MERLTTQIINAIRQTPEGTLLRATALLHLGSRAAIDQALSRLVKRSVLMRVGRGLYVLPVETRFGNLAPLTQALMEQLGEQTGEIIVSSGAAAANRLGLTTQVPVQEIYLTSGRSRAMRLGNRVVQLRHAKKWELSFARRAAGEALRALGAIGPAGLDAALQKLRATLPETEFRVLLSGAIQPPGWMAAALSRQRALG